MTIHYGIKKSQKLLLVSISLLFSYVVGAHTTTFEVPVAWAPLKPILVYRVNQRMPKMKLNAKQVDSFIIFLNSLCIPTPALKKLEMILPKTTVELLMAVHERGLSLEEAEKMAVYLQRLIENFKFQNLSSFDENTSHIIGREWYEIDYTGENMTWQEQQEKYLPYGILNFKSLKCLSKFFSIESKLHYFRRIYRPQNNVEQQA